MILSEETYSHAEGPLRQKANNKMKVYDCIVRQSVAINLSTTHSVVVMAVRSCFNCISSHQRLNGPVPQWLERSRLFVDLCQSLLLFLMNEFFHGNSLFYDKVCKISSVF